MQQLLEPPRAWTSWTILLSFSIDASFGAMAMTGMSRSPLVGEQSAPQTIDFYLKLDKLSELR
ncbi:MAG: hypothetical protein Q8Q80_09435 [Methyloversatilis sp.]|uniref:hypothetical protein n=1 Tax=Methyloversatilis sp. TaxID=2569862 RepID=UPI00273727FE|nr:hypothetical protein [Methyloversatilis sp.]MDP3872875.1 hypothetical protein [Methyloversatilis sp.]